MRNIWTIIKREYKESVYKKSFLIITLIAPVIMISFIFVPALLINMDVDKPYNIAVIDQSDVIFSKLNDRLDEKLPDGQRRFKIRSVKIQNNDIAAAKDALKDEILSEQIDGFLIVPENLEEEDQVDFFAKNVANLDLNRQLRREINDIVSTERIMASGLDPELVNKLTRNIKFKTIKIVKGEGEKERGFGEEYLGTFAFVFILYMTIILYGAAIMRSIIQEKNTRVIEVLLSSTNSFQLMAGKILGVGSVGLTQYLIWSAFGLLIATFGSSFVSMDASWFNFSPSLFVYFVLYFILGYFMFATLYAAIGAMTNTDQEAQQLSIPVVFMLVIPLMMISMIVKDPDSTIAVTMSLIPFFSPILMFTRINLTAPPPLEIAGSIIGLLITIVFLIWVVSKIYRIGILMYGKRPNLPEIMRWIRAK